MRERLQKALAAAGIASRRKAEEMIAAGAVTVNGEPARLGQNVDRDLDEITVNGEPVTFSRKRIYLAVNKPPGYVTSLRSTHGEHTVEELISAGSRLFPVGRLDKETSGLLLMTDDGEWANIVTHPRYEVEKQYLAVVRGKPSREVLDRIRAGVELPDGSVTAPSRVEDLGRFGTGYRLSVTVIEGKKRQIRLMAESVGHPVIALERVRIGPIRLSALATGLWRPLTQAEVEGIRAYGHRTAARSGSEERASNRH